jgi:hypothetical protein
MSSCDRLVDFNISEEIPEDLATESCSTSNDLRTGLEMARLLDERTGCGDRLKQVTSPAEQTANNT